MPTYTTFNPDSDIVIRTEKVFTNTWSSIIGSEMTTFTEFGDQDVSNPASPTASEAFFYNVFDSSGTDAEVQFSVSYGNKVGSGSVPYTTDDIGYTPSRSVYGQYRSLVYGDETRNFVFGDDEPDDIIIINIARTAYKQSLRLGSLKLVVFEGTLTDDSKTNSGSAVLTNLGRQFKVVKAATDDDFVGGEADGDGLINSQLPGFFYPDAGLIILNGDSLTTSIGTATDANNFLHKAFIDNITSFTLDTQENISSQYYFVRAKNGEFNYSTNPSFIDANGNLVFTSMIDNPRTYITTVGLYNAQNELLAVAKLSQPIPKDFTKEALIKVKLDY